MRDNDGRKVDHKTLEVLRMRAVELVAPGAHPEQVAVTMGFHKNTVYGWLEGARGRHGRVDSQGDCGPAAETGGHAPVPAVCVDRGH